MNNDSVSQPDAVDMWKQAADAWIADQGDEGDSSRRIILDPALETFLATLRQKRVLDVGCGEGRYSRKMRGAGAIVTGIDPVPKFVDRARRLDPAGDYRLARAEELPLESESFDVVLSYLSLMDVEGYVQAGAEMVRVLAPGGRILLVLISNITSSSASWIKDASGKKLHRTVDRYMEEFSLSLEWRGIKVQNFHRPLSSVLQVFLSRNCVLTNFLEPLPPIGHDWYEHEHKAPDFQILEFLKCPECI